MGISSVGQVITTSKGKEGLAAMKVGEKEEDVAGSAPSTSSWTNEKGGRRAVY